jgi:hypothetical protein
VICCLVRIRRLTEHAHSAIHPSVHALELFLSEDENEECEEASNSRSLSTPPSAIDRSLIRECAKEGVNVAQHNREFSQVFWMWQQNENDPILMNRPSIASTVSLASSSETSSSANSPHHPPTITISAPVSRVRQYSAALNAATAAATSSSNAVPHRASHSSNATAASSSFVIAVASPSRAAPASQPNHHSPQHGRGNSGTAGIGRNLSLDSSARALGLNIVYIQRLALPLLRSEIHSFFTKLVLRVDTLLRSIQNNPCELLRRMASGMRSNAARTDDAELKNNFILSAQQLHTQICDIITSDPSIPDVQSVLTAEALADAAAAASPLSPITSPQSPPPFSSPLLPKLVFPAFSVPDWWPMALQSTHTSLMRMRELFIFFMCGFDDAAITHTTSAAAASISRVRGATSTVPTGSTSIPLPRRASASVNSSPHRSPNASPTRSPATSINAKPASYLTSNRSNSSLLVRKYLHALPTTHCNRIGLQMLARLMQSFSLLVAMEGGEMAAATRLAVACQRLANTLLEKHHVEEPEWKAE